MQLLIGNSARDCSSSICDEVHVALTAAALQWHPDDDSSLSLTWCTIVDGFDAQGHEAHHHAIWAFALWGRECLYDLPEQIEDPDLFAMIEEEYLRLLDDMPVSSLIDRLERLHRARPPPSAAPQVMQSDPVSDGRHSREIEPFASAFPSMTDALRFFTDAPVLHWPSQGGIPVCELEDGRQVLLILHLFSGRLNTFTTLVSSFCQLTPLYVENYVTSYVDQDFELFTTSLRLDWLPELFPGLRVKHGALHAIYNLQMALLLAGRDRSARKPNRGDLSS